jgi:hypothetical protein
VTLDTAEKSEANKHLRVDLAQFGQRSIDVTPLALQHIDLLNAFAPIDWQSLVTTTYARGQHFAEFGERETQSLALQDQRQALAIVMAEKSRCAVPPRRQQTLALAKA